MVVSEDVAGFVTRVKGAKQVVYKLGVSSSEPLLVIT